MSGTSLDAPGQPAPDFLAMAVKLGAVSSLQKPFKPRDIMAAVNACLGHTPALEPTRRAAGSS
jgi:hypothetical protein